MRKLRGGIVALAVAALFAALLVAACNPPDAEAQRRPIPRAANAVDDAAGAFGGLCDEVRDVIRDYRQQGMVTGAFGVYMMGIPLLTVEWRVTLPQARH